MATDDLVTNSLCIRSSLSVFAYEIEKKEQIVFKYPFKMFPSPRTCYVSNTVCFGETDMSSLYVMIPVSFNTETFVTDKTSKDTRKGEKLTLCVRPGNPSPLLPTDTVICEDGDHECGQCFSRRGEARDLYQGSSRSSHRNKNHHLRVLTGKTGDLATLGLLAFKGNCPGYQSKRL